MIGGFSRLVQGFLYGLLALCQRAMCFLNRKRHNSGNGAIIPMHMNQLAAPEIPVPCSDLPDNLCELQAQTTSGFYEVPEREAFAEWDDWSRPTKPTNQHQLPQQNAGKKASPQLPASKVPEPDPEPEPDYFSDLGLAPVIKTQTRVLVKDQSIKPESSSKRSNRLNFTANEEIIPSMSNELGEWDDAEPAGWNDEEDLTEVAEVARRQTKQQDRQRRMLEHQKRKEKLEQKRTSKVDGLGLK